MNIDILVVDDENDIRELVAGILEDEGYRTRTARNSDEALAAIQSRRPHLVLTACRSSRPSRSSTRSCRW
jgi:two-component system, NtrC family, nitrogen regulation response regulator NtrX